MARVSSSVVAFLALTAAFAGCKKHDPQQAPGVIAGRTRTGTGLIRGSVVLSGNPPEMQVLPNQPCHAGAPPLKEESVVVDPAGQVQNVIVYLQSPPAAPAASPPPVTLDQLHCRYVPHVVALRTGQTLHVTTSDPTLHNVHGACTENDPFNFALVSPGESKDLTFAKPERFPVRCDVHPWMRAYVQVFPHPYFAVTGPDGTFEIGNVPAGSYTLVAWQERYGELRKQITITEGQTLQLDAFTFESGLHR